MRLKNYILEGYKKKYRGKEISEEEALKIAPKYSDAIKSFKSGNPLILRYTNSRYNYYLIDPKKSEPRKSANTFNYYTLIMDNSKKWSKYPKRSQSVICSIESKVLEPQSTYIVLPKNGAKIGVCKASDLWFSFNKVNKSMYVWNNDLFNILNIIDNIKVIKDYDNNISEFKKACKNFDDWVKTLNINEVKEDLRSNNIKWLDNWKGEPLYNYIDNLLEPKSNGFQIKNIFNLPTKNNEIWTDSECLMIWEFKTFKEYLSKVKI